MRVKDSKKYVEGLTNQDGVCDTFSVKWNNTYVFTAKKKGYMNAPVEVIFTKENSETMREIKLYLSKPLEEPGQI